MPYHEPSDNKPQYARVLITGAPGLGKTLLASTLEETLILDLEGRAAHAGRPRFTFTKDRAGLSELQSILRGLSKLKPGKDGALQYTLPTGNKISVRAVQLDSLDELQLNIDLALFSKGFDYWREMLEQMRSVITLGRMISAHFICVAHTREFSSETRDTFPEVKLALQGQAGQQTPRWFDVILNIVHNPQTQAIEILTQDTVIAGKLYAAKDALHLFGGKRIPMRFTNGRPDPSIMETILSATAGGVIENLASDPTALAEKLEEELTAATTKPIPAAEFMAYCKEKGWDMGENGEARQIIIEKFGPGYNAEKGQEYIEYLHGFYNSKE